MKEKEHVISMMENNIATITTKYVLENFSPILYVYHDSEGVWQFFGNEENIQEEDARVLSLSEIILMDPTIEKILHLPKNFEAKRMDIHSNWIISEKFL
jgi:hypothetical protein